MPTPKFARDPAPEPDGNIYIAVMHGNKIARFDTHTQTFHKWDLPARATCYTLTQWQPESCTSTPYPVVQIAVPIP